MSEPRGEHPTQTRIDGRPEVGPAGRPEVPSPAVEGTEQQAHPAVAAALQRLAAAAELPLTDRPAALEQVHADLADALGAVDGA